METKFDIDPKTTAVVVIDLQKGITAFPSRPHDVEKVIQNAVKILDVSRKLGMPVFLVHVTPSRDFKDALHPQSEKALSFDSLPEDWADFVPELNVQSSDFQILKRQWGAFYGTELDLQLRRREIKTIILLGISTNKGVESTARDAYERGYKQLFVEDAMSARASEEHLCSIKNVFPFLGKICLTEEVVGVLEKNKG